MPKKRQSPLGVIHEVNPSRFWLRLTATFPSMPIGEDVASWRIEQKENLSALEIEDIELPVAVVIALMGGVEGNISLIRRPTREIIISLFPVCKAGFLTSIRTHGPDLALFIVFCRNICQFLSFFREPGAAAFPPLIKIFHRVVIHVVDSHIPAKQPLPCKSYYRCRWRDVRYCMVFIVSGYDSFCALRVDIYPEQAQIFFQEFFYLSGISDAFSVRKPGERFFI